MKTFESLERDIKNRDIKKLREGISSICYVRRDFSTGEFDELVDYVINRGIELKDKELIGKLISEGKENYDEEDFSRAIFELKKNFCDERIEDVKKIGRALYGKSEQKPIDHCTPENLGTEPKKVKCHQGVKQSQKGMGILVAVIIILVVIYLINKL